MHKEDITINTQNHYSLRYRLALKAVTLNENWILTRTVSVVSDDSYFLSYKWILTHTVTPHWRLNQNYCKFPRALSVLHRGRYCWHSANVQEAYTKNYTFMTANILLHGIHFNTRIHQTHTRNSTLLPHQHYINKLMFGTPLAFNKYWSPKKKKHSCAFKRCLAKSKQHLPR